MSLDLEAALRQTVATSYLQKDVDRLLAGRLKMAPHPEWELPEEPTWREDPFSDRNWCFQFHMLRWLEPLRRAAAKGDDAAFDMWLRWLTDWVEANPPEAPRSSWAWTDMSDGIRAQHLCQAAPMMAVRRPDLMPWLEHTIRVHAEHLADPHKMGNANHALHQQESLFVCGRVLGEKQLWQLAEARMCTLLHEQYDAQGVNAEGATAYHYNNFLWWERALERFDIEGLPRPDGADRHLHAPVEIAHATRPDGTLVPIGDTDTVDPRAITHPAIDYVTSNGARGTAPSETTAVYDAGLVLARSGWGSAERPYMDQTYYSVRFGPSRRVHGHPDGGSLTYSAQRTNWVVDLGKFQYGASTARDHVASRAAHTLVSLDGKAPRKDSTVSLVRSAFEPTHHDVELADDSFRGILLGRRVIYSTTGEYLIVLDSVDSARKVTAFQRWQLGPEITSSLNGSTAELGSENGVASLQSLGPDAEVTTVRGREDPFDGWVSRAWKSTEPATAIMFSRTGTSFRFLTVLGAAARNRPVATLVGESASALELTVDLESGRERVRLTPDQVSIYADPLLP